MKLVKVNVDFKTGKRAGDIDPSGTKTVCTPTWQNTEEGFELRLVPDSFDVNQEGITLLEKTDSVIEGIFPPREVYGVTNSNIFNAQLATMDFSGLPQEATPQEEMKWLYDQGTRGMSKKVVYPAKLSEVE